jgi:hypothetical protein
MNKQFYATVYAQEFCGFLGFYEPFKGLDTGACDTVKTRYFYYGTKGLGRGKIT